MDATERGRVARAASGAKAVTLSHAIVEVIRTVLRIALYVRVTYAYISERPVSSTWIRGTFFLVVLAL
jgi:hypothetical protein